MCVFLQATSFSGIIVIVASQPQLSLEGGFCMSCSHCKAFLDSLKEFNVAGGGGVLIAMIACLQ